MSSSETPLLFGQIMGYAPGQVPAYSSDYKTADSQELPNRHAFRNYLNGVYTGYKWQCVEFARRYLLMNYGYVFDDIAMAYDIFRLSSVKVIATDERLPLHSFANGSKRHPEPGAMLIWSEGGEFETTGHVAIVTEVFADKIRVAEQNVHDCSWHEHNYSRELPASVSPDGNYWIQCSFCNASVLGWVMQTSDTTYALSFPKPLPALFNVKLRELPPDAEHKNQPWLNLANPDEAAYLATNGERLSGDDARRYQYFCISTTAEQEVKRAVNELHALFMHATDYVLQHPDLLAKFNLPKVIWPRLQQSWNNRRNQMITGRFDFCLTEHGLKLYEYNCDSASCHMEAGKVQRAWAKHYGCDDGDDAGEELAQHLIDAWRKSNAAELVHILLDEDGEEMYHALFMQQCMNAAGIASKIVRGLVGVHWGENNEVLDSDGVPIRWVWKTWAWETALDQLREELDEDAQRQALNAPKSAQPRLMDVLFYPDTLVFEPLWTLIPSNKAILPILRELFPNHPYLLNSQFELTDELKASGYVAKPIAGRCGHNIQLFDQQEQLLDGTDGQFHQQDTIYQELCPLPELDGLKVQLCSFSAGGTYAGSCTRVDESWIISKDSNLMPLRVLSDKEFKRG